MTEGPADQIAAERALQFLTDAARLLDAHADDLGRAIDGFAALAAGRLAELCLVALLGGPSLDGRSLRIAHRDPAEQARLAELAEPMSAAPLLELGVVRILTSLEPSRGRIPDDPRAAGLSHESELAFAREIAGRPFMIVPLRMGPRRAGVVVLVGAAGAPEYSAGDLGAAGALAGPLAHAIDRAQRQAADRAADQHAAVLEMLIANAPIGIAVLDTELRYLHINAQLAAMNGSTPEAHIGRTVAEMIPAVYERIAPTLRQVLATGRPALGIQVGASPSHKPGAARVWQGSFYPVRSADGAVAGVGTLVEDVTERRRISDTLERERRQLASLIGTLHEGVAAAAADGTITLLNGAARQIYGLGASDRLPTVDDLIAAVELHDRAGAPLPREARPIVRALRGEAFADLELRLRRRGGGERWVSYSGAPVFEGGRLALALVSVRDITAAKLAELTARDRTEELQRTNAELERAVRLKDEFLAMMSHELRSPLNPVLGLTELLVEGVYGPVSDRQRAALTTVLQSGRHLLAILSDILDLARIAAGNERLEIAPIATPLVCGAAVDHVRPAAAQKDIVLIEDVDPAAERIPADQRRLMQILVNLLDNAVKFTPAGGTVGLSVRADDARGVVDLTVWDTGIGIAREDYGRLFQPFTQVDGRLARAYGGIGLGLTLVLRLVELHHGSITLESEAGRGSRFTVTLPRASDGRFEAQQPVGGGAPRWVRPPRVLVADDDDSLVVRYQNLLRGLGCSVSVARDGEQVLALAASAAPDLLILDVRTPAFGGLDSVRALRAGERHAATPIVAVAGLVLPGDRERALAAGASAYLVKPVDLRALAALVAQLLPATL